jgi:hypothetical protein
VSDQRAWAIRITILATESEADEVVDRIAASICSAIDHPGPCATPWEIMRAPFDDLDEPERSTWLSSVEDLLEQQRAERAGTPASPDPS